MEIGIIGGGGVAQTFGAALRGLGHTVTLGIRNATLAELDKPRQGGVPLAEWQQKTGGKVASMADAAKATLLVNATQGEHSIAALTSAGADNLAGKVLIDLANALDYTRGFPPALNQAYSGHTSLGEQIQGAFPQTRVVKAFNTIAAAVMVNPGLIKGDHDLFIAGNDAAAKAEVTDLARALGWSTVLDMGDITAARGTESLLPFWLTLMRAGGPIVNLHVQR
jgi:predicted dinucleotide-binding enzyme